MKNIRKILAASVLAMTLAACTQPARPQQSSASSTAAPTPKATETAAPSPSATPTAMAVDPSTLADKEVTIDFDLMENCPMDTLDSVQSYLTQKGYTAEANGFQNIDRSFVMTVHPEGMDFLSVQYEWVMAGRGQLSCMVVPNDAQYATSGGYYPDTEAFWTNTMNKAGYTQVSTNSNELDGGYVITDTVYQKNGGTQLTVESSVLNGELQSCVLLR